MSYKMILPPFPFPERWADVDLLQRTTGEQKWLVPNSDRTAAPETSSKNQTIVTCTSHKQQHNIEHTVIPHLQDWSGEYDDYVETEELELDSAWAERFSKTIKKMKQKVHKAKRRAEWKKK